MTLAELKPGARGVIRAFNDASTGDRPLSGRLMEMGLTAGSTVELAHEAPFGGAIAVRCRGSLIALRLEDARVIEIDEVAK